MLDTHQVRVTKNGGPLYPDRLPGNLHQKGDRV